MFVQLTLILFVRINSFESSVTEQTVTLEPQPQETPARLDDWRELGVTVSTNQRRVGERSVPDHEVVVLTALRLLQHKRHTEVQHDPEPLGS